jgi:hypothetical protein
MPFLRCTSKLLADIDAEPLAEASPSPLGDCSLKARHSGLSRHFVLEMKIKLLAR